MKLSNEFRELSLDELAAVEGGNFLTDFIGNFFYGLAAIFTPAIQLLIYLFPTFFNGIIAAGSSGGGGGGGGTICYLDYNC